MGGGVSNRQAIKMPVKCPVCGACVHRKSQLGAHYTNHHANRARVYKTNRSRYRKASATKKKNRGDA